MLLILIIQLTCRTVAEAVSRFFKYLFRLDRQTFIPLLSPTIELIVNAYTQSPIGSYIYCGSVLVGEYSSFQEYDII